MNNLASALTGLHGERVALCDVAVSAVLQDLLAEVTVAQTYRNDESVNIEAVYTFPLPLDAVLLDLEVDINGRVLQGLVVEKAAAEEQYEDAVEAGDAAVMLEAIEPGLYSMNVGNLLPQETAKITFRYAILYRWAGDRLRLFLPTTIAPRFGESPHQPHQAPESSLTVENQFSLRVEVFGALRDAQFVCPSHAVDLVRSPEKAVLSLRQRKAAMDRDFILNVKAPQATRSFVLCGQDGEGMTAIASFQPFFPGLQQPRPLALAIVIDCSGSMQGDSMEQARQAIDGILESLQPQDRVTLIAFGSSTHALSSRLLACNKTNLAKARRFAKSLNADMGGTDIGPALREAYAAAGEIEAADVFLVTDGEVADWEVVVDEAANSGHRIFTVGVGSAVSEAFVRGLAGRTGGECELVSPREGMAERVVRHFERMRAPRASRVSVHWPEGTCNVYPSRIGAVFEGDTVVASAVFDRPHARGSAILEIETDGGEVFRQQLALPTVPPASSPDGMSAVARVAASMRLKEGDDVAGCPTALRYQLISPWTNWLVVAPRAEDEKAPDAPALRKVPQTLAAGWGGTGGLVLSLSMDPVSSSSIKYSRRAAFDDMDDDMPFEAEPAPRAPIPELPDRLRRLIEQISANPSRISVGFALDLLDRTGLLSDFDDLLRHADHLGVNPEIVAAIVVAGLLDTLPSEYVPDDARAALGSLKARTKEAAQALRELARRAEAVARLADDPIVHQVLRRPLRNEDLDRLTRMKDLVEHLDVALKHSADMLLFELRQPARNPRRQGGRVA